MRTRARRPPSLRGAGRSAGARRAPRARSTTPRIPARRRPPAPSSVTAAGFEAQLRPEPSRRGSSDGPLVPPSAQPLSPRASQSPELPALPRPEQSPRPAPTPPPLPLPPPPPPAPTSAPRAHKGGEPAAQAPRRPATTWPPPALSPLPRRRQKGAGGREKGGGPPAPPARGLPRAAPPLLTGWLAAPLAETEPERALGHRRPPAAPRRLLLSAPLLPASPPPPRPRGAHNNMAGGRARRERESESAAKLPPPPPPPPPPPLAPAAATAHARPAPGGGGEAASGPSVAQRACPSRRRPSSPQSGPCRRAPRLCSCRRAVPPLLLSECFQRYRLPKGKAAERGRARCYTINSKRVAGVTNWLMCLYMMAVEGFSSFLPREREIRDLRYSCR